MSLHIGWRKTHTHTITHIYMLVITLVDVILESGCPNVDETFFKLSENYASRVTHAALQDLLNTQFTRRSTGTCDELLFLP